MPAPPVSRISTLVSVQATYRLYITDSWVVACDEIINIPLAYTVPRQVKMNKGFYNIIPAVEFDLPITDDIMFNITTNEGVIVEPFSMPGRFEEGTPYEAQRVYFVLPRETTGIKNVSITSEHGVLNSALEFGIMPPPYNYDDALFGVVSKQFSTIEKTLESFTPHYGYATQKQGHTVNFSDTYPPNFEISEDTRFLTFKITNPLETSTHLNFELTSRGDASKSEIVTCQVAPGQNNVKIDLQSLVVFINNGSANKHDAYIIPPMQDRYYTGLSFDPHTNASLSGNVEVIEWA